MEMFRSVLVLGRVATTYMSANEAQTQVDPRVASFNTVLTHMLVGFSELDLVKVRALFRHQFLQKEKQNYPSSDFRHVPGARITELAASFAQTSSGRSFIRVTPRLSILCVEHRIHDPVGTPLLGRLGVGGRELRIHVHYQYQNSTIGTHTRQRILPGGQRDQPARVAPGQSFLKREFINASIPA